MVRSAVPRLGAVIWVGRVGRGDGAVMWRWACARAPRRPHQQKRASKGSRDNHPSGREGPPGPAAGLRRSRSPPPPAGVPAAPPHCHVRPPLLVAGSKPGSGFVSSQQEVGPPLLACLLTQLSPQRLVCPVPASATLQPASSACRLLTPVCAGG
jgi:hypothetical protein